MFYDFDIHKVRCLSGVQDFSPDLIVPIIWICRRDKNTQRIHGDTPDRDRSDAQRAHRLIDTIATVIPSRFPAAQGLISVQNPVI